jgi:hypothetical protein
MTTLVLSQFPWHALGLFVAFLVGGLIFVNQDMLDDPNDHNYDKKASEEKCRLKSSKHDKNCS